MIIDIFRTVFFVAGMDTFYGVSFKLGITFCLYVTFLYVLSKV